MVATLGQQIRFLGYDLAAEAVHAGAPLSFTLYWQALKPLDTSYTVFTHLLGPDNQIVGQQDNVPQRGSYPTTRWSVGEVVADSYEFIVDPEAAPGRYPLEIGMYRAEDVTRLPVTDAAGLRQPYDRILLPEIAVVMASTPTPATPGVLERLYLPVVGTRD
jgi:hypothetical protein